jgi:hypothetical protein
VTYTKGPWKVFSTTNGLHVLGIGDKDAGGITDANGGLWRSDPERKANASRIVACVNACEGLDNSALNAGVIQKLIEAARACVPVGICLTNPNVPEDTIVPIGAAYGELRALVEALALINGQTA